MGSKPNILMVAAVLVLVGAMYSQQNQTNPAPDSQKSSSAEPHMLKLVHREAPVYPPEAKAQDIRGTVVVEALVDKQGNVSSARVIEGDKIFSDAALTAVKAWKFEPRTLDGQPVEKTTVKIRFLRPSRLLSTIVFVSGASHPAVCKLE